MTTCAAVQIVDLGVLGQIEVAELPAYPAASTVVIRAADGTPRLTLNISGGEIVLDCASGGTRLRIAGALTVDADSVALTATRDMALRCGGDLTLAAGGRIDAVAESLGLEATRGDVRVTANDDVRLEGERVRMNA